MLRGCATAIRHVSQTAAGTGLSDGFPPGGVNAQDSNEFVKQMPYDVLAIGNHELYKYANTFDMHMNFGPHHKGRYLSSNVNITVFDANNESISVPVGSRFRKFKTRKNRSVTAFGVLFAFGNDLNTTVQRPEHMVLEPWFVDAIKDEPDVFLLVGHMPVARDRWPIVFNAIREVHPTTPILIFGGHSHIRDCLQLDGRSMSLASGRYMETLGWMSVNLDGGSTKDLNFSRRYLDANLVTYRYHTNQTITNGLLKLQERFNLTYQYDVSPRDYTMTRAPYPSNDSLLTLVVEDVVPTVLALNTSRAGVPSLLIISSGSQRFDIFKGPFTKNAHRLAIHQRVLPELNRAGAERFWSEEAGLKGESLQMRMWRHEREVETGYREWLEDMHHRYQARPTTATEDEMTLGYVTTDSCPGVGDDTPHAPLPFYPIPDFIGLRVPKPVPVVDLVLIDFIEAQLIRTLNAVQSARVYSRADTSVYSPVRSHEVLGSYAEVAWK
ncbi:Metallo-dependent phosphatase-like protein [Mycena polygramma]|nr:Metallo-dependent phosphatase-like protein [Mycena polygramma]